MNTPVLDALAKLTNPEHKKTYVLQHAHCGHIALKSRRRRSIEAVHTVAFGKGMHAWRVLLEPTEPLKGSCEVCEDDMAALAPKKEPRKLAAKKAARKAKAARA